MGKDELLKNIAESAYNIGFGAKKHFASYDIIEKGPNLIGFIAFFFGIFGLVYEPLSTKTISAALTILGISGLYIALYSDKSEEYAENGKKLMALFDELKLLYFMVKSADAGDHKDHINALTNIQKKVHEISISKQIFPSDWYAHYKFFWQHQIGWIDEQKKFRLFRDKIPLSLFFVIFLTAVILLVSVASLRGVFCDTVCL